MRAKHFVVSTVLLSSALMLLGSACAAVLSVGDSNQTFGGHVCADVAGGSLNPNTPVNAFDCNAEPNQQFELVPVKFTLPNGPTIGGYTIYAAGGQRCVGVSGVDFRKGSPVVSLAPGSPVESQLCKGAAGQIWAYDQGTIVLAVTKVNGNNFCLDATNMANGTQLVVNFCTDIPPSPPTTSQTWQIK